MVCGFAPGAAHAAPVPTTWCGGSNVSQTDRKPDLIYGDQVDVIYAHPTGSPDNFPQFSSRIASDIASLDAWWRKQDQTRTPRFDLYPFPTCASKYGELDLEDVTLPQDQSFYLSLDSRFDRLVTQLEGAPYNVNDRTKKYLIYYDAPVSFTNVCGQGGGFSNLFSTGPSWAIIYVQACGLNIGDGNQAAHVITHELLHSLGAVPQGAPHECPAPNDGHVCDSALDILYPFITVSSVFDNELLDVNHDDYYGSGGSIDIRNSPWLLHLDEPSFAGTVATAGSGSGNVTSDVGAINCPGTCSSTQQQGAVLKLTATAASDSRFSGWSGACTGTAPCSVTLDAAKSATATFALEEPLTVSVDASRGSGSVTTEPAGINCPAACTANFDKGQVVRLVARPGSGSRLEGWGGACSGRGECAVTLEKAETVTATFAAASHRLRTKVSGKGRVVSAPSGIACPSRCSSLFSAERVVSLRAIPAVGYKFAAWSGACRGRAGCKVTMSADESVRATFKKK